MTVFGAAMLAYAVSFALFAAFRGRCSDIRFTAMTHIKKLHSRIEWRFS